MSKKTLAALEKAVMRRYFQKLKEFPVEYSQIAGGYRLDYDKTSVALIRACHAHAKSLKGKL